jgi:hypothetical protein
MQKANMRRQVNSHSLSLSAPPRTFSLHPNHMMKPLNSDRRTDCVVPRLHPQTAGLYNPAGVGRWHTCWNVVHLICLMLHLLSAMLARAMWLTYVQVTHPTLCSNPEPSSMMINYSHCLIDLLCKRQHVRCDL